MSRAIIVLVIGFFIMAAGITYALIWGDFVVELKIMQGLPWFHLLMLDLYVGFLLFGGWIVFREKSMGIALVWILLLLCLGNLLACLYAAFALARSQGNWQRFWMGDRFGQSGMHAPN